MNSTSKARLIGILMFDGWNKCTVRFSRSWYETGVLIVGISNALIPTISTRVSYQLLEHLTVHLYQSSNIKIPITHAFGVEFIRPLRWYVGLYYLRQGGYVMSGVCLSVCLLATLRHPLPDPDPGIFEGFFNIARQGIFPQFGSYLWKPDRVVIKIVSLMYSFGQQSPC